MNLVTLLKLNKNLLFVFILLIPFNSYSQQNKSKRLDERIHRVSTLIHSYKGGERVELGSEFYYYQLVSNVKSSKPVWQVVESSCLITNKHLLYSEYKEEGIKLVDSIIFHLRRITSIGEIIWEPITLNQDSLLSMARVHENSKVDIVVINLGNLITDKYLSWQKRGMKFLSNTPVSNLLMPQKDTLIDIGVTDDIVVIGYPEGFYDEVNIFPIVKRGRIASSYGKKINGLPYFLIDSKLFPGSSGSLVISKPSDYLIRNGQVYTSKEKQYTLLGIYSGEPFRIKDEKNNWNKETYDLGIVWYSYLIEDIINDGILLTK